MTSVDLAPSSRKMPLETASLAETTSANMFTSDSDSSVYSSSSSSSTGDSPTTPSPAVMLAGNPTFRSLHPRSLKPSGSTTTMNSSSQCDFSEDEAHVLSDSSDSSTTPHRPDSEVASYPEPIFSSIPTRRVQSSNSVFRGSVGISSCPSARLTPSSSSPTTTTFPRRIPSFPVSRPIRPFDSISNAMGTAPKRVPPSLACAEFPSPLLAREDDKLQMKPKGLTVKTVGLETGKPKKTSNILLAPPKNSRFQHGFFILDMTQDEFKTRAW